MSDLLSLSVWDALACDGGVNVAELVQVTAAVEWWDIDKGWNCTVSLSPLDPQLASCVKRNVLRWEFANGDVREYRISDVEDAVSSNADVVTLTGQDPRVDLAEKVILSTTGSGGIVYYDDGRADATPQEYLDDVVIPAAVAAGVSVSTGSITPVTQLSLNWTKSSGLALIDQVVRGVLDRGVPIEFDYRRNGTTDYQVDFPAQINSGASVPELHVGRHVTAWRRRSSATDQASRVIPFGGVDGTGYPANIARAGWEITAKASNVLTLEDPLGGAGPIQFTNQHQDPDGDWYLQDTTGTMIHVTASARTNATQSSVTLASTPAAVVGDIVEFRADSSGTELTTLTHPTWIQAQPTGYGLKIIPLDRPALRGEKNLCPNPWARDWPTAGSPPTGYSVSYPNGTLTRETNTPPVNFGPYGLRVSVFQNNQFYIYSPMIPVFPVVGADLFTISISMTVFVAGSELAIWIVDPDHSTPNTSVLYLYVGLVTPQSIPLNNRWDLTIAGVQVPSTTTRFYVDIHQSNALSGVLGAYDICVDAINVTQTPNAADEFFEHPRGNALWQSGNVYLEDFADPPPDFEGSILDYERLDPGTWAHLEILPGASSRVIDDVRSLDYTIRAVGIEWNRLVSGDTKVRWSTRPKSIIAAGATIGVGSGIRGLLPNQPTAPTIQPPPPTPPPTVPLQLQTLLYHFYATGTTTTFTNLPSAETERTIKNEGWVCTLGYNWARLNVHVTTPASAGQLVAKFKTQGNLAWQYFDGASGPVFDLSQSGTEHGVDVAMIGAAQGDIIVGLFESGGNGTDDPVVGHVTLMFHNGNGLGVTTSCTVLGAWPQYDDWSRYSTGADLVAFANGSRTPSIPLQYATNTFSGADFVTTQTWYGHKVLECGYGEGNWDLYVSDGGAVGNGETATLPTDYWMRRRVYFPAGYSTPHTTASGHELFVITMNAGAHEFTVTLDTPGNRVFFAKDFDSTITSIGAASLLVDAGWVEVGIHYTWVAGVATCDLYLGAPCASLTVAATLSSTPGTITTFSMTLNQFDFTDPANGQVFYEGDWELVPSSVNANPFGYS